MPCRATRSGAAGAGAARGLAVRHALSFVLGSTLVFVALGASVGFVGYAVRDHVDLFRKVGGLFMIVMGLQAAKIIRVPYLSRSFTFTGQAAASGAGARVGYTRSVGTALLLAYSAGLAVPFLVAGFAVDRTSVLVRRMRPLMPAITIASGVVLIIAGMLVYTNALARYNRYFTFGGPGSGL